MPDTTSYSGPPQWLQQMWQQYLPGAFSIANRPYQSYQGPQVAGMSDITQQSLGGYSNLLGNDPGAQASDSFLTNLIGGGTNPYIDKMASNISDEANKTFNSNLGNINSIFSNPNSFGEARHGLAVGDAITDFGKGLGSSLTGLRYGAFNDDLNRRMSATGMRQNLVNSRLGNYATGAQLGDIPRQIQQQYYNQGQQNFDRWWNYPQQQAQFLGGQLGLGGQGAGTYSTTQQPNPNPWSQALGGGMLLGSGLGWFK